MFSPRWVWLVWVDLMLTLLFRIAGPLVLLVVPRDLGDSEQGIPDGHACV